MKKYITIEIADDLYNNAVEVLETSGITMDIAINMMIKKISNDSNFSFLLSNFSGKNTNKIVMQSESAEEDDMNEIILNGAADLPSFSSIKEGNIVYRLNKMTKSLAVSLFAEEGFNIRNKTISFASKNKSVDYYWANPSYDNLREDWYLILNDNIARNLYLFEIPKNSISSHQLVCRADKTSYIDLQLYYRDTTFTDSRSGYSFKRYLVSKVKY